MKIEFEHDELGWVLTVAVLIALMIVALKGCDISMKHTRWQQEHSITNR